jgi:hypothetical protein
MAAGVAIMGNLFKLQMKKFIGPELLQSAIKEVLAD